MNEGRSQWCGTHLKWDFQALIDHPDHQVKRLGRDLMRPTKQLFGHWFRCRDGIITRRGFERLMQPIRREIDGLLLRGVFSGNEKLRAMCGPLYERREWLWTFVDVPGVEPTYHASERALRRAVIWRKLSFSTQSAQGSRIVETILTDVDTCHRTISQLLRIPHRRHAGPVRRSTGAAPAGWGVNCYVVSVTVELPPRRRFRETILHVHNRSGAKFSGTLAKKSSRAAEGSFFRPMKRGRTLQALMPIALTTRTSTHAMNGRTCSASVLLILFRVDLTMPLTHQNATSNIGSC